MWFQQKQKVIFNINLHLKKIKIDSQLEDDNGWRSSEVQGDGGS